MADKKPRRKPLQRTPKKAVRRLRLPGRKQVLVGVVGLGTFAVALGAMVSVRHNWQTIRHWGEEQIAREIDARLQHIMVTGLVYTNGAALQQALGIAQGGSLVGFDVARARKHVEALPWVRSASIVRELPDTIKVDLVEYRPLARLQTINGTWVIDRDGDQIAPASEPFDHLPLLKGEGAAKEASALFSMLATAPEIFKDLTGAEYIGNRRWNMALASGATVMLPAEDPQRALAILQKLQQQRNVLAVKDAVVDLRESDRIVLRLPDHSKTYL